MRNSYAILFLIAILGTTFAAYSPGLSGTFVFDDAPNILLNPNLEIHDLELESLKQAAFSFNSGPLMRPISMLSFALNQYVTGIDPFYFKLTNLLIHLINGILVYILSLSLFTVFQKKNHPHIQASHAHWFALLCTAAWLLHPLNLTSVLYIVQRMTSLSTLFILTGLILFVWGRTKLNEDKGGLILIVLSIAAFTPLAALSKENGILLPLYAFIIEIVFFGFRTATAKYKYFITSLYTIIIALPAALAMTYILANPEFILSGYQNRTFSLTERIMTEGRVLWFYIFQIIAPNINQMGLFHDDIILSKSLFEPLQTLPSLIGLATLGLLAFLTRNKAPLVSFAILFFFVGHTLESTIFPLEIAHEHRNYLPMLGILMAASYYLLNPYYLPKSLRLRIVLTFFFIFILAFGTFVRSTQWGDIIALAHAEVSHHPDSVRANNEMASIYQNLQTPNSEASTRNQNLAIQHYQKSIALDPNMTHGLFQLLIMNVFPDELPKKEVISELNHRLANAPFASDIPSKIQSLISCQESKRCSLSQDEMNSIFDASLANPGAQGETRAAILFAKGIYYTNLIQKPIEALSLYQQMIDASPKNINNRLNYAKLLFALKLNNEALEQIVIINKLDQLKIHSRDVIKILTENKLTPTTQPTNKQ